KLVNKQTYLGSLTNYSSSCIFFLLVPWRFGRTNGAQHKEPHQLLFGSESRRAVKVISVELRPCSPVCHNTADQTRRGTTSSSPPLMMPKYRTLAMGGKPLFPAGRR